MADWSIICRSRRLRLINDRRDTDKPHCHSVHFFFLSIGREPTMWPANNCLQIMVCSCLVPSTRVLLQIIFCSCVIGTTFSGRKWQIASSSCQEMMKIWKPTWWSDDKTIIELGYLKLSWFVSVSHINYLPQPSALAIVVLLATDKSRYFAQPCPIIVKYFAITEFNNCFIIRSPSLFSYFNHFLAAQGSDQPFFSREGCSNYTWEEYCLQQNSLDGTTHEQTIIAFDEVERKPNFVAWLWRVGCPV